MNDLEKLGYRVNKHKTFLTFERSWDGDDWKELGSETYYFRNFEEFVKIFRKETLYRIPMFQIIDELE